MHNTYFHVRSYNSLVRTTYPRLQAWPLTNTIAIHLNKILFPTVTGHIFFRVIIRRELKANTNDLYYISNDVDITIKNSNIYFCYIDTLNQFTIFIIFLLLFHSSQFAFQLVRL